jgi:hypothetical protein
MPRTCRPIEGPDPPAAVVSAGSLVQHIIGPVADPFQLAAEQTGQQFLPDALSSGIM